MGLLCGTQGTEIVLGRNLPPWLITCEAMEAVHFCTVLAFVDQHSSSKGDGVDKNVANKCGDWQFAIEYGRWRLPGPPLCGVWMEALCGGSGDVFGFQGG